MRTLLPVSPHTSRKVSGKFADRKALKPDPVLQVLLWGPLSCTSSCTATTQGMIFMSEDRIAVLLMQNLGLLLQTWSYLALPRCSQACLKTCCCVKNRQPIGNQYFELCIQVKTSCSVCWSLFALFTKYKYIFKYLQKAKPSLNGSWWFLNCWLHVYLHKTRPCSDPL